MVDFNKKISNSSKFRQAAIHFQKYGKYTMAPSGTTEYATYWEEETNRCLDGYTAEDGDWISGYNYFYLNYCPIQRVVEREVTDRFGNTKIKRVRDREFPSFYDYDYFFFQAVQQAEDEGKHLTVLKSRRKGYSYKCGSMLCRNFYLIPESKSYAYAAEAEFLVKDGILTKAWEYMDFMDTHTVWAKKRQKTDTKMHRRASAIQTDDRGQKIEIGYKSEIMGVTIKNDYQKVRGKVAKLIVWEEAGKNVALREAWNVARPSVEQDGIAFGLMISFGTGGDATANFDGLKDMFYSPEAWGCVTFPNIWDTGAQGTTCGFFVPQWTNLDTTDSQGRPLMDEDGNSIYETALEYVMELRRPVFEHAKDVNTIDRYVAEQAITPREACLQISGNIFPKKELVDHLANIRIHKKLQNHKQVGDLVWGDKGKIEWKPKKIGDITTFPLGKNDDKTGSVVIWEHPDIDSPYGLYIAGLDPYDFDQSTTDSLGSIIIWKRFQSFEKYYDLPVAEYTGRPATADMFYEECRKLLTYYNAKCLYENEKKGVFTYFTNHNCDYLLLDTPDIVKDIVSDSKVNRQKGIHMTQGIKDYGVGRIRDWLIEEYAPGEKNLKKILSEPLLEELINYNDEGNFDRVIALILIMIYKDQMHKVHVKKTESEVRQKNNFFGESLFTDTWFHRTTDTPRKGLFNF